MDLFYFNLLLFSNIHRINKNFLSLKQEEGADKEDQLATELVVREQKIMKLQQVIEEQRENEKIMYTLLIIYIPYIYLDKIELLILNYREQSMTEYENQLASLRLEVMRLRNYDCYAKEIPHQDLQTQVNTF